jgi:lactate permease
MFLPLVSTMMGFCMLWIVGKWQAVRQGWLPCLLTGGVIGLVAYFTNRFENLVVLTGVLCGLAVIAAMALYLKASGNKIIDRSLLNSEELDFEKTYPLWRAFMPWLILIGLILALNIPKDSFNFLYRTLRLPINGLAADGKPLDTRALWQAYTWILASTVLALPFLKPNKVQMKDTMRIWLKRAPRPVFAAAIFFAIGEIMNMSGYDMALKQFAVPSMIRVLADYSTQIFGGAYGAVVSFIGLFGGFLTGSEASAIAMFAKYTMTTAQNLGLSLNGLIIVTAGLAFGGGLASVVSPAKLQNAAASIDRIGEETKVIKIAFVFSLILTAVTSLFVVVLLRFYG